VALQFATGYTVAYLVYTVGTLITAPASLNVPAALIGLVIVAALAALAGVLIRKTDKSLEKAAKGS
jgi:ferrous iron transport protein B